MAKGIEEEELDNVFAILHGLVVEKNLDGAEVEFVERRCAKETRD